MKRYPIKECFLSLQGEGVRAGCASVFLRFAGCNLTCRRETHGFDCDTDFSNGRMLTAGEVVDLVNDTAGACHWVVLTGGEPALFLDADLASALGTYRNLAIETNGTLPIKGITDWVTVSPKRGEPVVVQRADEVKVVLAAGDPLPQLDIRADHYLVSPAFVGNDLPAETLRHCIQLCLQNPRWKLSEQQHKRWRIR